MRKFYKKADATQSERGWTVTLDGRPLRTPAHAELVLPSEIMARAIASEWDAQGEMIDPVSMPFTGFANAAIDHVGASRDGFADGIAVYGESDLLCYRAPEPDELVAHQCRLWDPLLDWAKGRYDIAIEMAEGVMHRPQPAPTLARLRGALDAFDDFALAVAQPIVSVTGSLIITLALLECEIDAQTAWTAGHADEDWQAERWGRDSEAEALAARQKKLLDDAAAFLALR